MHGVAVCGDQGEKWVIFYAVQCFFSVLVFLPLAERLNKIYPELLKRMDDSNEEIRILTTRAFSSYFKYEILFLFGIFFEELF